VRDVLAMLAPYILVLFTIALAALAALTTGYVVGHLDDDAITATLH
jgi:hypothetical protein